MNGAPWATEDLQRLVDLWLEGVSSGKIATEFGVSRNAVMGVVNRLGLPGKSRNGRRMVLPVREAAASGPPKLAKPAKPKRVKPVQPAPLAFVEPPPVVEPEPIVAFGAVTIIDLRPGHCRWIDGPVDGAATLYCGEAKTPASPYCECHATRALGASPPRAHTMKSRFTGAYRP